MHNQPVEMRVDHIDTRTGAPMTKQTILDMGRCQRVFQQEILPQINLCGCQIIGGTLITGQHFQLFYPLRRSVRGKKAARNMGRHKITPFLREFQNMGTSAVHHIFSLISTAITNRTGCTPSAALPLAFPQEWSPWQYEGRGLPVDYAWE